jgi:polyphosphate kinase 2 (PPK2 family)
MFEAAELGRKISREEFDSMAPSLRTELLDLQQNLRNADFPVIILFAGVDGAGKNETVNLLNEWMDPRWIVTRAYGEPSDEEAERPEYWRYWRDLPPKGKIGLFLSSWYHHPLVDHAFGRISGAELDEQLERIEAFEKTLADEGALILKFWMHLSEKAQKKRLKTLEKDPHNSWQVTASDWQHYEMYPKFIGNSCKPQKTWSVLPAPPLLKP